MDEHQPYDPEVYKRLDLVRKQFERNTADQKSQQSAEKRQELADWLKQNKQSIVRWAIYVFLVMLVLAVIGVTVADALVR
jgi:flagellar biosynthesis/type III secretory pathway M-ring protein FliF/YscJ